MSRNTDSNATRRQGMIRPADTDKQDMFIGWAKAPSVDRRFLLGALPLSLLATTGASYAIASNLDDPGAGAWLTGETIEMTGLYFTAPYPHLRIIDEAMPGGVRTVLVVTQGKCTTSLQKDPSQGRPVTARGFLIERKNRQMLEVPPLLNDWLEERRDFTQATLTRLSKVPVRSLGQRNFAGAIMDSKCFFGVMRPARGMTHKACATLCIRGGIPPSFWVRDAKGREEVMLMTTATGEAMGDDILPLIADPVRATGEIVRVGDLLQFRADGDAFERV